MRLFLDANILFSAAHTPAGRAAGLFLLARQGRCELLSSPHAIEEARRNIRIKYPDQAKSLEAFVLELCVTAEAPAPLVAWAIDQSLPLEDAPILAAAVASKADVLLTGDRTHFGHLYGKSLRGVEIVSPAAALAKILR
jgi:predicted nucleic acid-binding protein